jgi:hypothetical protein
MRIGVERDGAALRPRKTDSNESLLLTDDSTTTLLLYSCDTSSDGHPQNATATNTDGVGGDADTLRLYMTDKSTKDRIGIDRLFLFLYVWHRTLQRNHRFSPSLRVVSMTRSQSGRHTISRTSKGSVVRHPVLLTGPR